MTQTVSQPQSKAVVPYLRQFSDEEKGLLASLLAQVAPKATNDEKRLFLYQAQKKGLDPFTRQIYLVPRWDAKAGREVHAVQVSIDGLRLMAQRSGKYAGQTPYQWCGPDGKWVDVWLSEDHPVAARCGILRHDFKEPLYSVALFKSYKQTKKDGTLNVFWEKYDAQMLAKCAEAQSIRRGFPEETSGFYIPEEMGNPELVYVSETEQDDNAPVATSEVVDSTPAQASGDEPQYPIEIIRLLSEFKTLEPAWCNARPNWDRVLLTKVLELQTLEPFPVIFDEDDISRVELYVESVKQKKAKAGTGGR